METNIWLNNRYTNIIPNSPVNTMKAVTSFTCHNKLRNCLFKTQGGYYKLCLDGLLVFVCQYLYQISFEELYNKLKD